MLEKIVYPWQISQWEQIWQTRQSSRLPHALLFVGVDGLGKSHFAAALARAVLCQKPDANGVACGECHACRLSAQQSHPDLVNVAPIEPSKSISVDQIRELVNLMSETTLLGGYRVIVINPANRMNMNAANALLKTLEEPTPKTLIILISDPGLRLPATIVSRCQKILFHKPSSDVAHAWLKVQAIDETEDRDLLLKLADGAPLKALLLMDKERMTERKEVYASFTSLSEGQVDPVAFALRWQDRESLPLMDLLVSFQRDVLRFQLTRNRAVVVNHDFSGQIARISDRFSSRHLLSLMDHMQQTRATLLAGISLNKQLLLEDISIRWVNYVSG